MLAGKSVEEKTTWCCRLWKVILLGLNMLKLTMRNWTSQINSMRVVLLVCLIVFGWRSWRSIHCSIHAARWVGCVRYWWGKRCDHCGYIVMGMSLWVWLYWCMWVRVDSGSRSLVVRSHMFVQSEHGGYEYCWIWYRLIRVRMAKWWRLWCCLQQCANFCAWWLSVVCICLRKELWGECWFLYAVSVGITGNCGCRSRLFLYF